MLKPVLLSAACLGLAFTLSVHAADTSQPPARTQAREQIYGYQLMTPQERNAYRSRMRNARTQQERNRIREEHHAAMQARAQDRGATLPDRPLGPRRGRMGGPGRGAGPGPGRP